MRNVVCWDFDFTLASSKAMWSSCVLRALKRVEPDTGLDIETIKKRIMIELTWNTPDADHTAHRGEGWWRHMNARFEQCYVEMGVDAGAAGQAASLIRQEVCRTDNYMLYPDARAALEAVVAAGGCNLLVSNNYPELPDIVAQLGLGDLFCGYAVSGAEGYEKPREELFAIARRLGGEGRYTMVGDNIVADVGGAKHAGMRTVYVHRGFDERADWCFDDLISIKEIL